jgi:hypothetical protein
MAQSPVSRKYEAKDVFQSALGFNATCDYLNRLDHKNNPIGAAFMGHPIIALSALTLELLLKTLHAFNSRNPVPGHHNLGGLYRGLPQPDRIAIQKRWVPIYNEWHERWDQVRTMSGVGGTTPKKAELALDEGARAFEQARYTFNPDEQHFNYYLDHLRKPLIALIVERHPDLSVWHVQSNPTSWQELAQQTSRPPEQKP